MARNLVIILSDQLRRDALGVYGDPNVATPHIDAVAAAGARFTNFSSTYPVCVPFRFSLMTGQYAHSRFVPAIEWRMSPSERTLADEFNDAGYRTIYVGKWHLHGGGGCLPHHESPKARVTPVPRTHQGRWSVWRGFEFANAPFETCYFVDDDPTPRRIEGYQTDGLFDLGMEAIGAATQAGEPFCAVISVEPPHFPKEAPEAYSSRWRDRQIAVPDNFMVPADYHFCDSPWPEERREQAIEARRLYYAMIENLDDNVGRLVSFLEERGVASDTYVVFVSDHGEMGGAHAQQPSEKMHPWEESVGIPFIVRGPGVQAGRVVDAPCTTEDIYPTLLGLLGLNRPAGTEELPGHDLTELICGSADTIDRAGVLLEFVHDFRANRYGLYHEAYWRAFRTERYKYVVLGDVRTGGVPTALFDLRTDPGEMTNLIARPDHQQIAGELHGLLRARMVATEDHYVLAPAFGCPGLNTWQNTGTCQA